MTALKVVIAGPIVDDSEESIDVSFTPTVPADWSPQPTTVDGALNQLGARNSFGTPVSKAAGSAVNMTRNPAQSYWYDSTGAQNTAQLPAAPLTGDVVIVKNVGAAVASPILVVARGGATVEDPGNRGNFSAANGTVGYASQGGTLTLQYDGEGGNSRWGVVSDA